MIINYFYTESTKMMNVLSNIESKSERRRGNERRRMLPPVRHFILFEEETIYVYACVCMRAKKHLIFMVQLIGRSALEDRISLNHQLVTPRKELAPSQPIGSRKDV